MIQDRPAHVWVLSDLNPNSVTSLKGTMISQHVFKLERIIQVQSFSIQTYRAYIFEQSSLDEMKGI